MNIIKKISNMFAPKQDAAISIAARDAARGRNRDTNGPRGEIEGAGIQFSNNILPPSTLWDIYLRVSWVRACVNSITRTATGRGWGVRPKKGYEKSKGAIQNCEIVKAILHRPNNQDDGIELFVNIFEDNEIFGRGFWELVRSGAGERTDPVVAMYTLDPVTTEPKTDKNGKIEKFVQKTKGGKKIEFEPWEVIYFPLSTKGSSTKGISPLQSLEMPIATDIHAQNYNLGFFKNDASPGGIIDMEGAPSDVVRRNREYIDQEHKGSGNSHKFMILEGKTKFQSNQANPKEAGFLELRSFDRDEILAVYGVPPSKVSIIETGNIGAGSGEQQDKTYKKETVEPKQTRVSARINRFFIEGALSIYDVEFFWNPIDTQSEKEQSDIAKTKTETFEIMAKAVGVLLEKGVISVEEARAKLGIEGPVPQIKFDTKPVQVDRGKARERRGEGPERDPSLRELEKVDDTKMKISKGSPKPYRDANWFENNERFIATKEAVLGELIRWKTLAIREIRRADIPKSLDIKKSPAEDLARIIDEGRLEDILSTQTKKSFEWGGKNGLIEAGLDPKAWGPSPGDFENIDIRTSAITVKFKEDIKLKLRSAIRDGIQAGEGIDKIAERIGSVWDKAITYNYIRNGAAATRTLSAEAWATLVARTETLRAFNSARKSAFESQGILLFDIQLTTGAEEQCISLAASGPYEIADAEGLLPVHPNCRCTIVPSSKSEASGKTPQQALEEAGE